MRRAKLENSPFSRARVRPRARPMPKLTEYTSYADAQAHADADALWALFDGTRERFNIAHECVLRHADDSDRTAVRIAHADGADESLSFDRLASGSARFAHWLTHNG